MARMNQEATRRDIEAWVDDLFVRLELVGAFRNFGKNEHLQADADCVVRILPPEAR